MDLKIIGVVGFLLAFILVVVLVTVAGKRAPAEGKDTAGGSGVAPVKPARAAASPTVQRKGRQAGRKAG